MTKQYDAYSDLITFTRASTGTYLDSDGLLKTATSNTPRIEFDINGNRKGILIEEARTNLLRYSEELDNAAWSKVGSTVIANNTVAPDGNTTADKVVETTLTTQHRVDQTPVSSDGTQTFSVFAKPAERSIVNLRIGTSGGGFNLSTGSTYAISGGVTANIVLVGNGWYRCSITLSASANDLCRIALAPSEITLAPTYEGDGTSGIFIWGAQLEAGSFPTSYISTAGAAATRAADVASIPTSAFGYNAKIGAGGTVIADFQSDDWQYSTGFNRVWEFDGSGTNGLFHDAANPNQFRYRLNDSGGTAVLGAATIGAVTATASAGAKIAIAYAPDDFAVYANGSQAETDNAGLFANEIVTQIAIGGGSFGTSSNGHIKSIQYYPRRLTNAQLQRLTS